MPHFPLSTPMQENQKTRVIFHFFHDSQRNTAAMTTSLLAHGRGTALAELGLLGLALGNTLGKDLGVFVLERKLV